MPLSIKEEAVELSSSSSDVNCMVSLSIKKEPVDMSNTSSSTNNMPLNITDEMPDNVFLKIEIEENVESIDSSFSVGDTVTNDLIYCKNIDVAIKDEISKKKNLTEENIFSTECTPYSSFSSTDPNNIHERNLVNSDVLTHTKNNNSLQSQKTKENASKLHVADDSNTNHIPLPLIIPLQNIPCSSDNFGNTNCIFLTRPQYLTNGSPNTPVFRQMSNYEKHINNTIMESEYVKPTNTSEIKYSENVLKCINNETLKPLLSDPFGTFSSANEQLSCIDARKIVEARLKNSDCLMAQNVPFITECSTPILNQNIPCILKEKPIINPNVPKPENVDLKTVFTKNEKNDAFHVINIVRNESIEQELNESISSVSVKKLIINPNISSISKEKSINTPSIIENENSVRSFASVQVEKVREIRDNMHTVNKKTLEHNENNSLPIKESCMLNRRFVSILKEKPIINPHNLNDENSAIEPALVKEGKFWEIRDGKHNIIRGINKETLDRFIPTSSHAVSSQNKSPINESLKNAEMKNTDLLQNKDNTDKADDRSCLNSYAGHNSTFLVENAGKTVNIRISEDYGESTNVQNSRETGSENASQFQNKQYRRISDDRILFWSAFAANKSTILTKGAQKSVNENTSAKIHKSALICEKDAQKSVNENTSAKIHKSTPVYGKGALVYDRLTSGSQTAALTDVLQPLYKYIKDNKCLLCGFESKSTDRYTVKKHLFVHLPEKNFKCDICGKCFSSPDALSGHKINAHAEKKSEVYCKDCNEKLSSKSVLYYHMQKHHKPTQICSICNREFKEARNLKEHLRIHTGEKPYSCAVCDGTFRTRDALKAHSLNHNQEKLHSCKLCDKSYNRRSLLKEHMNSHNKTSDIKCKVCGKTFNYKSNLAQHMFTHADERPHKCETCGLKFKLSHHLRSHLASHHT